MSIGSGTERFLSAFRKFPEPVLDANTPLQGGGNVDLDFLGSLVNRIVTEHPEPTVGTGFHSAAATATEVIGPRFHEMETHAIPVSLELKLPVFDPDNAPTHSHFVTADDGTFGFYVSGPSGLTNVLSLLQVPDKGLMVAQGVSSQTQHEHAVSYGALEKIARSRGLSASAVASAVRRSGRSDGQSWRSCRFAHTSPGAADG